MEHVMYNIIDFKYYRILPDWCFHDTLIELNFVLSSNVDNAIGFWGTICVGRIGEGGKQLLIALSTKLKFWIPWVFKNPVSEQLSMILCTTIDNRIFYNQW